MTESCWNYKFCQPASKSGDYLCRRFPPQVGGERGYNYFYFPEVALEQWCGEWKPKELKQEGAKS